MERPPWIAAFCYTAAGAAATVAAVVAWRRRHDLGAVKSSREWALQEARRRLMNAHRAACSKEGEAAYCEAVERWVTKLRREAGEKASVALLLGAQAQHLERGAIPRSTYPTGREGYLRWRAAVKKHQGKRFEEILADLAPWLGDQNLVKARALVAKTLPLRPYDSGKAVSTKGPARGASKEGESSHGDAEMQCVEDAACLVFLEDELMQGFPTGKDDAKMVDILQKSWKKMSRHAHELALTLEYTPRMLGCVAEAIAEAEVDFPSDVVGEGEALPLPVPVPSSATLDRLRTSWSFAGGLGLGEAWYEELRKDPEYGNDLGRVLDFPVCRPSNVERIVTTLLDQLCACADSSVDATAADAASAAAAPRFATILRAAALLGQRHAGLRLRHVDAMRSALVTVVRDRFGEQSVRGADECKECGQAWEAFGYAVGAQLTPFLMLTDPVQEFCRAVATPLPTPGAGPCAAVLAAKGVALLEMALSILRKKELAAAADGETGPASRAEVAQELAEMHHSATRAAAADAHAYCGLLATSVFDTGGTKEDRQERRAVWRRLCAKVPLDIAECAVAAAKQGKALEPDIRRTAPSAAGDLCAGQRMLKSAGEVAVELAALNLKGNFGPGAIQWLEDFTNQHNKLLQALSAL